MPTRKIRIASEGFALELIHLLKPDEIAKGKTAQAWKI